MSRCQDSSPRTSALAGLALLVAQTASALSDPQSPTDTANDTRNTDFRYGADYNGLDITRPDKAYVEMRLDDRTSVSPMAMNSGTMRRPHHPLEA